MRNWQGVHVLSSESHETMIPNTRHFEVISSLTHLARFIPDQCSSPMKHRMVMIDSLPARHHVPGRCEPVELCVDRLYLFFLPRADFPAPIGGFFAGVAHVTSFSAPRVAQPPNFMPTSRSRPSSSTSTSDYHQHGYVPYFDGLLDDLRLAIWLLFVLSLQPAWTDISVII
jgi:hypothetical protein